MRPVIVDFKRFNKDILDFLVTKYPQGDHDLEEDEIIEEDVENELEIDEIKDEEE